MIRTIRSVLSIYRWKNSTALAALFLVVASPRGSVLLDDLAGAAAWFFTAAGAYALNDLVDLEIDRVNHRDRPLPAGQLSVELATASVAVAFVTAVLCAAVHPQFLAWILPCLAAAPFCSAVVRKHSAALSNAMTSTGVACIPASVSGIPRSWTALVIPALAFAVMFARELQMDRHDVVGDRLQRPLPVMLDVSQPAASWLYRGLLAMSLVLLALMVAVRPWSSVSAAAVFVLAGLPLMLALRRDPFSSSAMHARLLKAASYGVVAGLALSPL
jgi:geranylgeranylglycerol-phosphate geranylgeranyltransferase